MVIVSGNLLEHSTVSNEYPTDSIQMKIYELLSSNENNFIYSSFNQFAFELDLRAATISASRALNRSRFSFRVFRRSFCNPRYWERTDEGGFELKEGAIPSEAISDIYTNGSMYGTECATAMVIVFYKAMLDVFKESLFNSLFTRIYLMDWQRLDRKIGINSYYGQPIYLPGDCRYFKNPDVDPAHPEWQGENAIDLGDGYYYGHGMGIVTAQRIIQTLNTRRIPGSETSAYLMDMATRPNYRQLYGYT